MDMNAAMAIHQARASAGLSQAALASRAGTSQATLSAYENGRKQPSIETLDRLLAATGSRLTIVSGRQPVVRPSKAQIEKVSRTLSDVLDLAAALPTRHDPELRFPRLPTPAGGGS
jgi:transcriptional regulator with XRE-family HTH domain